MKKTLLVGFCIVAVLAFACIPYNSKGANFYAAPAGVILDIEPVDLGDNNDYGGDGGGGWGGSDDWGGGGDSWGGSGGSGGSGGGNFWPEGAIILAVFFAVAIGFTVYSAFARNKKRAQSGSIVQPQIIPQVKDNTAEIASAVMQSDGNFSAPKFIAWVREVFFTLQYAWMEKDIEKLRIFEKEELFRQHEMQIRQYIQNGRVNVLDRINVKQAYLHKYVRDRQYEHISVFLQVRMIDYIKDGKTGAVLKGSPGVDCHMQYLYTFSRKTGVKSTEELYKTRSTDCPNCGAPTTISSSGKCQYCGSLITTGEFNWVLSDIVHIKAGTVIDNSGSGVIIPRE